jgi:anti-anti-sigma regulatory factor
MNPKKRQRLKIQSDGTTAVVSLDHIEIWDGADLALLREVLSELISQDGFRSIGVDLASVKYIPSGFFGMLFEWYDSGVDIQLHSPQPNVEQMLWFRMFFSPQPEGHFQLSDEAVRNHTPNQQVEYHKREFMPEQDDEVIAEEVDSVRYGMSTTGGQDLA